MEDLCPLMSAIWRLLSAGMQQPAPTLKYINASEKRTGSVLRVEEVEDGGITFCRNVGKFSWNSFQTTVTI